MKAKAWARKQTVSVLKRILILSIILVIPSLMTVQFYLQKNELESYFLANKKMLVIAFQTGDYYSADKALDAFKKDKRVISLSAIDKDGRSIFLHQRNEKALISLNTTYQLLSNGSNSYWGKINILWTPSLSQIFFSMIVMCAALAAVSVILFFRLNILTQRLVTDLATLPSLLKKEFEQNEKFEIDEVGTVIKQFREIYSIEIQLRELESKRRNEIQLVELARRVAHDIRSPMSIFTVLQSLEQNSEKKDLISNALIRMNQICNDLLQKPNPSEYLMKKKSAKEVLESLKIGKQYLLKERCIELNIHTEINFLVDNEFDRHIDNLINNALESVNDIAGVVNVSLLKKNNRYIVEIIDNGKGIPVSVLQDMGKVPITYGKGDGGNGLGFYYASKWIKNNGGDLRIKSEVASGTCVEMIF